MAELRIDPNSPMWEAVATYAKARIEELKEQAISPMASHADREQAAHRAAELVDLLAAPRRAVELARTRVTEIRSTY